jgi:dTDP-4-amino-4,6-dideoxygalactose transaminase
MGEKVKQLESRFSEELNGAHVIAVTNCTAALHLAFAALGIGPGDEVILPSITFVATANAVRYVGATPVFADITGIGDPCVDPEDIQRRITPRTRAICVVHYAGFPCDMVQISNLACKHGLSLVEDCAHSLFSWLNGVQCGLWGDVAAFSFFSNKNMTCGEGGLVVTHREEIADDCRLRRSHGMTSVTLDRHEGRATDYDVVNLGFNYRMDEIRAAFALAQLDRLPGYLAERKALWRRYRDALELIPEIQIPDFGSRSNDVGVHIMPVTLPRRISRDIVIQRLRAHGIQTSIHYTPVHFFSSYKPMGVQLPRTEEFAERELTLPFFPAMSDEQIGMVISALKEAIS